LNPIDLLPALAIFGVFVVLVLLPQMREKREHDTLVSSLAKGDRVVTASGIHGLVASVAPETVELEVGEGVTLTIDKTTIARRNKPAQA
jgi:preprotein translocase subunit YajC